jgi:hypothetical protein
MSFQGAFPPAQNSLPFAIIFCLNACKNHKNRLADTAVFANLDNTLEQSEPVADGGKVGGLCPIRNTVGVVQCSESHKDKKRITGATITMARNQVRLAEFYPRRSGQHKTVIQNLAASTCMQV